MPLSVEFMAALMNSVMGQPGRSRPISVPPPSRYRVLPPDVNANRVCVTEMENIGSAWRPYATSGRTRCAPCRRARARPYRDLGDFASGWGDALNKRMPESPIKAGAFDSTGARLPS